MVPPDTLTLVPGAAGLGSGEAHLAGERSPSASASQFLKVQVPV
jgi:hypothetical protein